MCQPVCQSVPKYTIGVPAWHITLIVKPTLQPPKSTPEAHRWKGAGSLNDHPEDEIFLCFAGQVILAFLPVGHRATQSLPKFRPVMAFGQVNQFVHDDVVHQPDRELKDFPVEKEHAVLAAGALAES